jgi:5-formyltetrahydrofolate cyclo-ligase
MPAVNSAELVLEKKRVRRELRRILADLPREAAAARCADLHHRLEEFECYTRARHVLGYFPMDEELPLESLWHAVARAGKLIYLPVIRDDDIEFRLWDPPKAETLERGVYGIPAPPEHAPPWPSDEQAESLVIVPGLGFSSDGRRLGRGAGFYDRFLLQYPYMKRIALCLREQIRATIPADESDARIDYLISC